MEEYLKNVKTFRSQINEFEDQAASISVEEQKLMAAIEVMEKELDRVINEIRCKKANAKELEDLKSQVCFNVRDQQKKFTSNESQIMMLNQALELLQKEQAGSLAKLQEKSNFYNKVNENMSATLQEQQAWFDSHKSNKMNELPSGEEGHHDKCSGMIQGQLDIKMLPEGIQDLGDGETGKMRDLISQWRSAKAKVEELTLKKNERTHTINETEFKELDLENLEEEYEALLSDKSRTMDYLQSLEDQMKKLKGIDVVNCGCGKSYNVEMPN
ncbi:hypothetical protein QJS04_geneDACA006728 [Acorus gramineus]|uniref:Uncharacterized protein n=1 Tax=Acorus gramineus TaxID=55184 RepID=A0AAV9AYL8_ACOGR|nr:hypothetical protein QJS04_geneDACA006728 [Acorus gramineus]